MEYQKLRKLYELKGYPFFEDGRANIFGIRTGYEVTDKFDDILGVAYVTLAGPGLKSWKGTTDAGRVYVLNPLNVKGTAIVVPGFYQDVWEIGLHNGKYLALIQTGGPIKVYRDNNRDGIYDKNPASIDTGYFGINCHHKGYPGEAIQIDNSSAGCQVFESVEEFTGSFMPIMSKDSENGFKKKSYALFDLPDFQLVSG